VQGITVQYPNINVVTGAEQRHIDTCFRAVIAAFITFLDRMIAVQKLTGTTIPIDQTMSGEQALTRSREHIDHKILQVASDRALTNPKKIESFAGLSDFSKDAAKSYFALRRCLEHHDGIPDEDIDLIWRALRYCCGDREKYGSEADWTSDVNR
jgi:hypothetical protein